MKSYGVEIPEEVGGHTQLETHAQKKSFPKWMEQELVKGNQLSQY